MFPQRIKAAIPLIMSATAYRSMATLAIRRETINVWERRAPLAPHHVKEIIESGTDVLVQPSTRRSHYMQEYEEVGAKITEDLSSATHIIGVKAPDPAELIEDKVNHSKLSNTSFRRTIFITL